MITLFCAGVNSVQYNPYTEPVWQAAVRQFELNIQPAEERVAAKLKHQLRNANLNTLQVSNISHSIISESK